MQVVLEWDPARYRSQTKIAYDWPYPIQGDSGGPLTVVNADRVHTLVGIVSKRLGESCSEQEFAVFTSVSALLPWIESSIKENGGMASCSFDFSAPPSVGMFPSITLKMLKLASFPHKISPQNQPIIQIYRISSIQKKYKMLVF